MAHPFQSAGGLEARFWQRGFRLTNARAGLPILGPEERALRELVLVGGGHAHVQVLRRLMMRADPGRARLSRARSARGGVLGHGARLRRRGLRGGRARDRRRAAGAARRRPRRARARAARRRARRGASSSTGGRRSRYDVASLDVGSTVRGLDLPGVREHALATRPIRALRRRARGAARAARGRGAARRGRRRRVSPASSSRSRFRRGCAGARARAAVDRRRRGTPGVSGYGRARAPRVPTRGGRARRSSCAPGRRATAVERDAVVARARRAHRRDLVVWATGARAAGVSSRLPAPARRRGLRARRLDARGRGPRRPLRGRRLRGARRPRRGCRRRASTPCARARSSTRTCGRASRPRRCARYRPQRDFLSLHEPRRAPRARHEVGRARSRGEPCGA